MTTSPYSQDLRIRVLKYLKSGGSQREAAKLFKLSPTTVNLWNVRYKKEGHCLPRKRPGAKPRVDKEEFMAYVKSNPHLQAEDIGRHFGLSAAGALYWLRKLNFKYKKKPLPTWRLIPKDEKSTKGS